MKRILIAACAFATLTLPGSAAEYVTAISPDVLVSVPVGVHGRNAKAHSTDGYRLDFGFGINRKNWNVEVVVFSVGGFLGIGAKCVAVTPASTNMDGEGRLVVRATYDELKAAPSFSDQC